MHEQIINYNQMVGPMELTATEPSTLIRGILGKTMEPSGIAYISMSEQLSSLR